MKTVASILESYTAADEQERLSMFLTHRSLRRQFTKIDLAGLNCSAASSLAETDSVASNASGKIRFADNCWGWLKHCFSDR